MSKLRRPDLIRLKSGHKYFLYLVLVLLFFSGLAWAFSSYLAPLPNEFQSSSKLWAMKIHGAAAMAILVLLGTLLNGHVKFAWMAHRNRINGVLVLATFAILTLTGYGLYYSGSEKLRTWTSWVHLCVGLFLPILLVFHIWLGRRTRLPSEL